MHWTFLCVGLSSIVMSSLVIGICAGALSEQTKYAAFMESFFSLYPKNFDGTTCYENAMRIVVLSDKVINRLQSVLNVNSTQQGTALAFLLKSEKETLHLKKVDDDLKQFYMQHQSLHNMYNELNPFVTFCLILESLELCAAVSLLHGINTHKIEFVRPWTVLNKSILIISTIFMAMSFIFQHLEVGLCITLIWIPYRIISAVLVNWGYSKETRRSTS